ncbi:MAG: hypothetical protein AB2797_09255, partial [Candidatus Thiodiazotropha sp.]
PYGLYCGLAITVLTDRSHRLKICARDNLRYRPWLMAGCDNLGFKGLGKSPTLGRCLSRDNFTHVKCPLKNRWTLKLQK